MDVVGRRIESDFLGAFEVPESALYGVQTARALENFPALGPRLRDVPQFCSALGMVKLAALRANLECGALEGAATRALERACKELIDGEPEVVEALVVPLLQGGAGTSTNMNVNEVLANRALTILGHPPGSYEHCHPNDHVNRSQSTNDVYPTALRVALVLRDREMVTPALEDLAAALRNAADRFAGIPKLGRTQLQDAVPMTVDQEIGAWADGVDSAAQTLAKSQAALLEVNLGGTAVGTGLAAPPDYRRLAVAHLRDITGLELRGAVRPVSATTDPSAFLTFSAALRTAAIALAKIANDLRLLASGPRAGLGEYHLPALQAGSSMMPGKVNPVACEFVNQIAFRIRGLDLTAATALDSGQLQLNAMLPAVAEALFEAQALLGSAARVLARRCIEGLEVDKQRMAAVAGAGFGQLTELAAVAGYRAAAELAVRARKQDAAPDELARQAASSR